MVVELSLKTLIHLEADPDRTAWGRNIERLCAQLSETNRRAVLPLLELPGAWRTEAVHHSTGQGIEASSEVLACRAASYAAAQFPADDSNGA